MMPVIFGDATRLTDGTLIRIRPISPQDESSMVAFHQGLSDRSVYFRYFHLLSVGSRTTHTRLAHICSPDPGHEFVVVAEHLSEATGQSEIVGVGRLVKLPDSNNAEFAVIVEDAFQHRGLGRKLLERLIQVAREVGLAEVEGQILLENRVMADLCRHLGFNVSTNWSEGTVVARLALN